MVKSDKLSTNQTETSSNHQPVREWEKWKNKHLKIEENALGDIVYQRLYPDDLESKDLMKISASDLLRLIETTPSPIDKWDVISRIEHHQALAAAYARGREEREKEISAYVLPKAKKFIDKVESGRARSKETYADMKTIRDYLTPTQPEKEGRDE